MLLLALPIDGDYAVPKFVSEPQPDANFPDWFRWKAAIEHLWYIVGSPRFGTINGDAELPAIELVVRVSIPQRGPFYDIREEEPVWVVPSDAQGREPPWVIAPRPDFPVTPHSTRFKWTNLARLCLARQPARDWWVGRTILDVLERVKLWFDDAAAGLLVKPDEPYEPLALDYHDSIIELDCEQVRAMVVSHKGRWITTSKTFLPKGRDRARFALGAGDVPTVIFFQQEAQNEPWSKTPTCLENVATMAEGVGLNGQQLVYWVNKRKRDEHRVLIVLGTRRPKEVLGQVDAEEWVAFDLTRNPKARSSRRNTAHGSFEWEVTPHMVRNVLTPLLAQKLGNWSPRSKLAEILVIGAGFAGSIVDIVG